MNLNFDRFAKYAWFVVGYTIFVILFGALVRATGSGAGCGSHWPLCNGDVVPQLHEVETLIELSHRITSSIDGLIIIGLLIWAWRQYPAGSFVRRGAVASLILVIIEGGIGAALVRLELVGGNASVARAWAVGLHLGNTLLLLGALTLTAWRASGGPAIKWNHTPRITLLVGIGLFGALIMSGIGAVTALGDTLFPVESLAEGIAQDFSPDANFLIRLRVFHPVMAIAVSIYWFMIGSIMREAIQSPYVNYMYKATLTLIVIQTMAGIINVLLLAPVWMQLLHLLLADLFWIAILLLSASALAPYQKPQKRQRASTALHSANGKTPHHSGQPIKTRDTP